MNKFQRITVQVEKRIMGNKTNRKKKMDKEETEEMVQISTVCQFRTGENLKLKLLPVASPRLDDSSDESLEGDSECAYELYTFICVAMN